MEVGFQAALLIIALVSNLLSALAGGGAGLVQLPALILLGLPLATALATHKIATVALGLGATLRYLRANVLDRSRVVLILACGLPGVVLGAQAILHVPPRLAELGLGVLTIGLGLYSLARPALGQVARPVALAGTTRWIGGGGLFLLGVLNGSLTSGSGLFVTLWLVRWFGLDYRQAVAFTMVLVGLFWNGAGAVTLGLQTEVAWAWLPALLAGSVLGGYLGAHLAVVRGNRLVKRTFEVVTILVGLSLLLR